MGTCPSLFLLHFTDTHRIANLSSSSSSILQALTNNEHNLIRIDLLHIKCEFNTYNHPWKLKTWMSLERFALKTVPVTVPFAYDMTEWHCCTVCVVTVCTSIVCCASKGWILHCWDAWRLFACKSMRKIFINGQYVMKPVWDVSVSPADHGKLLWLKIDQVLTKCHPKNDG